MIVYHGSSRRFKTLRISESLVSSKATRSIEGLGIYFSLYRHVAYSYGQYLYTLEVNDKYVLDFREKTICQSYLKSVVDYVKKVTEIDISLYFNPKTLIEQLHWGGISISGVARELELLLDSNYRWYELPESKIEQVYKAINKYVKETLCVYLFNYNIEGVGIIKKIDPNIVRIVNREKV